MLNSVTLTLTDADALNMRMALNATACQWGEKARLARNGGRHVDADTCERIRAEYHDLWELVRAAQEAPGREAPDAHIADNFASHYENSDMQRP